MELLYKYLNGNMEVSIYDDGTKIQEWDDDVQPHPIYPNSMDIKITNYCDANCKFCHEMSTTRGRHGDLSKLLKVLEGLPKGTELAIGGGNPLDHPNLLPFLYKCRKRELICNITVNSKHLISYIDSINYLLDNKLVYGLGLSISDDFNFKHIGLINKLDNVVYHVIAGVNSISILNKINKSLVNKVLILGYKEVGRGIGYYNEKVEELQEDWYSKIKFYIGKVHLSFDNLAIKQLRMKRFFTDEEWKNFYMGSDGQFTMYIDAVNQEFAVSSTSVERYRLTEDIREMFLKVRTVSNFPNT